LLSAATIDRAAIEALRAEQVALADATSKRLAQALADTADVLTPEQRVKLAERVSRRMGRWS
jgi:Spy/CpxP family protein refolding chaperone